MRDALRSFLGAFVKNTSVIQFIFVSLFTWHSADLPGTVPTYPAQSRPTWHRAGLLGKEPAITVALRHIVD